MRGSVAEEDRPEICRLWATTSLSAREIGLRYGVTKNIVMGIVSRAGVRSYGTTLLERMDMLEEEFARNCGSRGR